MGDTNSARAVDQKQQEPKAVVLLDIENLAVSILGPYGSQKTSSGYPPPLRVGVFGSVLAEILEDVMVFSKETPLKTESHDVYQYLKDDVPNEIEERSSFAAIGNRGDSRVSAWSEGPGDPWTNCGNARHIRFYDSPMGTDRADLGLVEFAKLMADWPDGSKQLTLVLLTGDGGEHYRTLVSENQSKYPSKQPDKRKYRWQKVLVYPPHSRGASDYYRPITRGYVRDLLVQKHFEDPTHVEFAGRLHDSLVTWHGSTVASRNRKDLSAVYEFLRDEFKTGNVSADLVVLLNEFVPENARADVISWIAKYAALPRIVKPGDEFDQVDLPNDPGPKSLLNHGFRSKTAWSSNEFATFAGKQFRWTGHGWAKPRKLQVSPPPLAPPANPELGT